MNSYHQINEATFINMTSKAKNTSTFEQFLKHGGTLVKQSEPETKIWFALKGANNSIAIFDAFYEKAGRDAHFSGQVANALKNNAKQLVVGGWQQGVLNQIVNSQILSSKLPNNSIPAHLATYFEFKANPGKENEVKNLLSQAAKLVAQTEPHTLY